MVARSRGGQFEVGNGGVYQPAHGDSFDIAWKALADVLRWLRLSQDRYSVLLEKERARIFKRARPGPTP